MRNARYLLSALSNIKLQVVMAIMHYWTDLTLKAFEEMKMDVKINKSEWDGVSADDQKKIQQIIASHFKDTKIVPDANASAAKELVAKRAPQAFSLSNPICSAACGVAEAAAVAACSALSGPLVPICVAAAHAAGEFCRSKC
jgi:hypothetical protein